MTPTPQADLEWATGPHPFAPDWCDAPGTHRGVKGITPAEWEAGRLLRASRINPTWNVDVAPHKKRGRKPGYKGRQRRVCMVKDGIEHYLCIDCRHWIPKAGYCRHTDPASVCGILSVCRKCDTIRRQAHRLEARRRAIAKREADEAA